MVRCITKRKRDFDLSPPTTANSADNAIRIGCDDSPTNDFSDRHTKVCSISDDIEPARRQSSLLSFFTKAKKAKPQPKPNTANGKLTSKSNVRNVKTKTVLPSSPLPLSSSSLSNSAKENPSMKSAVTTSRSKLKSLTQVYIDCGQSKFGQILCNKCGMLYMPGITEDENQHKRLCQAYSLGIPCNRGTVKGGRKVNTVANENDTNCNDEASIVSWRPCVKVFNSKKSKGQQRYNSNSDNKDCPSQWPLLAQMISKDLGTDEETTLNHLNNEIVFLYIGKNVGHEQKKSRCTTVPNAANRYRILGVATVQLLGQVHAYRMISLHERSLIPVTEAKLGIGLLWTHPVARKRGIATKLVHAARENAVFGMRVARQDVAFSNPTQAGYNFALRYIHGDTKTSDTARNSNDATKGSGVVEVKSSNYERQLEEASHVCSKRGPLVYEMDL